MRPHFHIPILILWTPTSATFHEILNEHYICEGQRNQNATPKLLAVESISNKSARSYEKLLTAGDFNVITAFLMHMHLRKA